MSLTSGTRLGPYEIVSQIGAGGMGEVYKATDTRLQRTIAIKVLPEHLAADPQRLARFQREAQTISSLNHPHICALHDVGDEAGTRFLVMEYVEGQNLEERLERGPVPLDDALEYATQIADALDRAHQQGIVHRDLKPGNVMITKSGVKLLDFGLAKLTTDTAQGSPLSRMPTLGSRPLTEEGAILGTFRYMAPEQLEGREVDVRTDIYALCLVLYEMITAQRVFEATSRASLIGAILKDKPRPLTELQPITPPQLDRVVQTGLEKDPDKRWQSAREMRHALEWIGLGTPAAPASAVAAKPSAPLWSAATAVLAVVAVLLGIVLGIGWWRTSPPESRSLVRLDVDLGAEFSLTAPWSPIISPDGSRLAWVARIGAAPPRLYTRRLGEPGWRELPGTEDAQNPFFSPDGEWIGFSAGATVKKISVQGGAVAPLAQVPRVTGASWGADGSIVATTALGGGLVEIDADGAGDPIELAALGPGELGFFGPQILPGGASVLFWSVRQLGDAAQANIEVFSLAGKTRKIVQPGGNSAAYLPTGHLAYHSGGTLYATGFDLERLETFGATRPVLDDVLVDPVSGAIRYDFSITGTFVYLNGRVATPASRIRTIEWLDSQGNRDPLVSTPGDYRGLRLSPDADKIALLLVEGLAARVAVFDPARDDTTILTFDAGLYAPPTWTPDGQYVVWGAPDAIWYSRLDGAGPSRRLWEQVIEIPFSFSPGWHLAYVRFGRLEDLMTVPVEGDTGELKAAEPEEFLVTSFSEMFPRFSPDGRWIAYASDESGRWEVSVRAFPPPTSGEHARFPISNAGGSFPVWSRNTSELFYRSLDGEIMVADYTVDGDRFDAGRPRVWSSEYGDNFWDMAPDGRALIAVPTETEEAGHAAEGSHHVVFLQNFFDHLQLELPLDAN